jgi:hypothetical protein
MGTARALSMAVINRDVNMRLLRSIATLGTIASFALPASLLAQAASSAQIFTSIDNSFPEGSGLAGFGLTLGNAPWPMRPDSLVYDLSKELILKK